MKRNLTDWGETFNIEFDIMIDSRLNLDRHRCSPIVTFQHFDWYPGAFYCSFDHGSREGLAFECDPREWGYDPRDNHMNFGVKKLYPIKNLKKMYHVQIKQYRQIHMSTEIRRFIKLGDEMLVNYELEKDPIVSKTVLFEAHDIIEDKGHIYNLKLTN